MFVRFINGIQYYIKLNRILIIHQTKFKIILTEGERRVLGRIRQQFLHPLFYHPPSHRCLIKY